MSQHEWRDLRVLNYDIDVSDVDYDFVLSDLAAEGDVLDALVAAEDDWTRPTPAAGWTIAHQIAHLAAADVNVLTALRAPAAFDAVRERADAGGSRYADDVAAEGAARPRAALLDQWRAGRAEVVAALREVPRDFAFPWFGSTLTAALMGPLRVMEIWAHGQDVFDTVGVAHPATTRLKAVAWLGVKGVDLSFAAAQLPPPKAPLRFELAGPGGETWAWGPRDAAQRVRGSALGFCIRVTHRRPLSRTGLTATGQDAQTWLEVARVFL
ncbi:maleylpyruvate isomerase family mycothiol-dependent enzyme [Streptomyces sp. NPDC056670]|uniref:maleylpyruvate isomerase family mycothiol-dependent enzyme n=1 Tax=Streptomyces sp. NPDC056670 TaxID=3345904 RepID=UPI0036C7774D